MENPNLGTKSQVSHHCLQRSWPLLLLRNVVRNFEIFFLFLNLCWGDVFGALVFCMWQKSGQKILLCLCFSHSSTPEFGGGVYNHVFSPGITTSIHTPEMNHTDPVALCSEVYKILQNQFEIHELFIGNNCFFKFKVSPRPVVVSLRSESSLFVAFCLWKLIYIG